MKLLARKVGIQMLQIGFDQFCVYRRSRIDHVHLQSIYYHTTQHIDTVMSVIAGKLLVLSFADQTIGRTTVVLKATFIQKSDRFVLLQSGPEGLVALYEGVLLIGICLPRNPFRFFDTYPRRCAKRRAPERQ